jgi:hypothetical protein
MKLREQLDTAIVKYGSGPVPEVLLGSASAILGAIFPPAAVVPIGLQAGLKARITHIQQRRMDDAQTKIGEQLEEIEEEKVDKAFVESDAFFDWLYEVFDRIRPVEDAAKLEALRNIFLNGILIGQSSGPVKDIVLRRVGELSPHQVLVLRTWECVARPLDALDNLNTLSPTARQMAAPFARREELRAAMPDLMDTEFDVVLNDLRLGGVLANWYPEGTYGFTEALDRVALTDFGAALLQYMKSPTTTTG